MIEMFTLKAEHLKQLYILGKQQQKQQKILNHNFLGRNFILM